jgi:7-carboxy-7-deazaguanine synthase
MTTIRFPVMEIFGPTVQGEGMVIGQKTMFVRTAGCDYSCVWCDSAFTWNGTAKEEIRMLTVEEILGELRSKGHDCFSHVTISGGNPALLKSLHVLIERLHDEDITVALETQGSVWQDWFLLIDELTLSPKPPSSRMSTDWEMLDMIVHKLLAHRRHFCLKVVVFDDIDLTYATKVHQRYSQVPMFLQAGNDDVTEWDGAKLASRLKERYERLIEAVMASHALNRVRVLPQLHTWVWGNKRGV